MITYEHTRPDTWDREASLLGIFCDKVEAKKRNKHFLSVEASDSRNEFVLFAIHEYGGVGPQAEASIDSFVSISPDPVKLKTHVMRRIAAPMVGGMVSATILTLALIPAVFLLWQKQLLKGESNEIT